MRPWLPNIFLNHGGPDLIRKLRDFRIAVGAWAQRLELARLRAFCRSRPSADLCAFHRERGRDRRTLRGSIGFMRIANLHAVRRGDGWARAADRAAAAGVVLASHCPLDSDLRKPGGPSSS